MIQRGFLQQAGEETITASQGEYADDIHVQPQETTKQAHQPGEALEQIPPFLRYVRSEAGKDPGGRTLEYLNVCNLLGDPRQHLSGACNREGSRV